MRIPMSRRRPHARVLVRWMEHTGTTYEALGEMLQPPVSKQAVADFLKSYWPRPANLERYSQATGISVATLEKGVWPPRRRRRPNRSMKGEHDGETEG